MALSVVRSEYIQLDFALQTPRGGFGGKYGVVGISGVTGVGKDRWVTGLLCKVLLCLEGRGEEGRGPEGVRSPRKSYQQQFLC